MWEQENGTTQLAASDVAPPAPTEALLAAEEKHRQLAGKIFDDYAAAASPHLLADGTPLPDSIPLLDALVALKMQRLTWLGETRLADDLTEIPEATAAKEPNE